MSEDAVDLGQENAPESLINSSAIGPPQEDSGVEVNGNADEGGDAENIASSTEGSAKRKLSTEDDASDSTKRRRSSGSNSNEDSLPLQQNVKEDDAVTDRCNNNAESVPSCSTASTVTSRAGQIKIEPSDPDDGESPQTSTSAVVNPVNIKPAIKVEKADASSTSRESCKFGVRCYRRNPMHRVEQAHPGDHDYKRPSYPPPPVGTPDCPYGIACYRRNPVHFQMWYHPPDN